MLNKSSLIVLIYQCSPDFFSYNINDVSLIIILTEYILKKTRSQLILHVTVDNKRVCDIPIENNFNQREQRTKCCIPVQETSTECSFKVTLVIFGM